MSSPVFGKRHAALEKPGAPARAAVADEHAAFFAAVRAEMAASHDAPRKVVPRSFKAAFLAGLVVGCALAGFHVTGGAAVQGPAPSAPLATIAAALGTPVDSLPTAAAPINMAPVTMFVGLLGGARMAALTLIVVHAVMGWIDATSRIAYAIGGALVSAVLATTLLAAFGHAPEHGWIVEIAAGATAGFLYRMFAGVRPSA